MMKDVWCYRETSGRVSGEDLTGYTVEAVDGSIGAVDEHSDEVGSSYLVIDTGPWIFGKEVLLPAGTVIQIDPGERKIHVDRTKEQIRNAPEFDREKHLGAIEFHGRIGGYYEGPHRL